VVNSQEWLLDFVRFYRDLGFFAEHSDLSDEYLADWIRQRTLSQGLDLEKESCREDYLVLSCDRNRVWGVAFDVFDSFDFSRAQKFGYGWQLHEEIVNGWSGISRGSFCPEDVRATWASAEESIRLEFVLANVPHTLCLEPDLLYGDTHYEYCNSTLLKLSAALESLMSETDYRFEIWDLGCAAIVMCITAIEKNMMVSRRGAYFSSLQSTA
jgi:hypothetical protein